MVVAVVSLFYSLPLVVAVVSLFYSLPLFLLSLLTSCSREKRFELFAWAWGHTEMVEMRSIRAAAYFLLLSLLVSQRQLGSCASINEQGGWAQRIFWWGNIKTDDRLGS